MTGPRTKSIRPLPLRQGKAHESLWLLPAEKRAAWHYAIDADLTLEETVRAIFLLGLSALRDLDPTNPNSADRTVLRDVLQ